MTYELKIEPICYDEEGMKTFARSAVWRFHNIPDCGDIEDCANDVLANEITLLYGEDVVEAIDDDSWLNFVDIIVKETKSIMEEGE